LVFFQISHGSENSAPPSPEKLDFQKLVDTAVLFDGGSILFSFSLPNQGMAYLMAKTKAFTKDDIQRIYFSTQSNFKTKWEIMPASDFEKRVLKSLAVCNVTDERTRQNLVTLRWLIADRKNMSVNSCKWVFNRIPD
jgi:hypothetical protein